MEEAATELGSQIEEMIMRTGAGFVLGCVPLLIADHKGQRSLGFGALLICTGTAYQFNVVGAWIACAVCTLAVLFLVKPKETPTK